MNSESTPSLPHKPGILTPYPSGSLKELWTVTYPMILSMMSNLLMLFIDNLVLAKYDINVMNAVSAASMMLFSFVTFGMNIAAMAEVFVGQHNGAKRYHKLGEPIWQMLYFSLLTSIVFIPLAFFAPPYLLSDLYFPYAKDFFKISLLAAPLWIIDVALSSFFVGQGKAKFILVAHIIGNIVNLIFIYPLVFGYKNIIPSFGAVGSAYSTIIGTMAVIITLFIGFLNKENRSKYGTLNTKFNLKVFLDCFKIGSPNALSHCVEIAAWALLFNIIAVMGPNYVTVYSIGRFFILPFFSLLEGTQKGVIAVASNYIGIQEFSHIRKMISSAAKLVGIMSLILTIPFFIFPEQIISWLLADALAQSTSPHIIQWIRITLIGVWLYFIFDGITWTYAGVLTSGGDTKFIMISNIINSWVFCILPIYILIVKHSWPPYMTWILVSFYAFMNLAVLRWRYLQGKWKNKQVVS